jgi:uncharacterized protein (TIGR02646 family)
MIQLPDIVLGDEAMAGLRALQAEVDSAADYAEQVARGKRLFELRNTPGNLVFDEVKRALDRMCSGALRCAYCEDSRADEIEHVRPKSLYPGSVFAWSNYVYACGPCNGPKGNHFAVFVGAATTATEVGRKPYAPIVPPLHGEPVLIDPRLEDATNLMILDLRETYLFTPLAAKGTRDRERADYTIRTLRLNARDDLLRSRRQAYLDYVAHLHQYRHERGHHADAPRLAELRDVIRRRQHPTVWREMQRQHDRLPALRSLFAEIPEAITW